MSTLNAQQRAAVRHIDGPLLVLAGAGSGKTRVITEKLAYLIDACGYRPGHLFALTFTNKAAREMKTRAAALLGGKRPKGLTVSTFHTLGLDMLRREHARLGYRHNFSLLDGHDSLALLRELMRGETVAGEDERARERISRWKSALVDSETALAQAEDARALYRARLYARYERALRAYNAVDLDDLVVRPVRLLQGDAEARERWQNRVRHLLVDEYQDTNEAQYQLVRLLIGVREGLTAVGDDDQSVYAWRGAQPENLAQLARDFPRLEVIKLEQNYRSTGRILKAANRLIAHNPHVFEKRLWSALGYGDPIRVIACRDGDAEAQRVVAEILHHRFTHRTRLGEYAILYRGNHQARPFERVLREHQIPYYLSGGTSFFERTEIKDVMAYLRLAANLDDDAAFLRIANTPRRELGPTTIERLGAFARERGTSLVSAALEPDLA
ncbi:MAG: UvrD-helicase domain-containing protein, partial [Gammaproteobacteria bacterium]|nr:UvrD-helicase domain-containing protein [Gammaproteobacteria bacterium]